MSEFNTIGNIILRDFIHQVEKQGLTVGEMLPETGQLSVRNADGQSMLVSLINLVDYYYRSRDQNAVGDFVANVVATLTSQKTPGWEEAKNSVYVSLYPSVSLHSSDAAMEPPFAKEIADYCSRYFILDMPSRAMWVTPGILEEWDISEAVLERQTLANGDSLLGGTDLMLDRIEGRPLGSFGLRDRTLNAALLLAPGLKNKVLKQFGWPLYAVIPNKITCCFFGQADFDFFIGRLGSFVANAYENQRHITPELLEFSDAGIKPICTWVKRMGHIIKFDSD